MCHRLRAAARHGVRGIRVDRPLAAEGAPELAVHVAGGQAVAELFVDVVGVQQVQALGERRIARALALTTQREPQAEEIAREADSTGGNLDAYTAKELVSYNIKVLDEHLPIAFDILADLVLHPKFDEADIEKEKGVILEELKMEVDNPEYLVHETFFSRF